MAEYLDKMAARGFEELILIHDKDSGLKAAIAIHSTSRGPALGGTRMWSYPSEAEAIADVMRLARGMSYKAAAAELPLGGGKGVIIGDPNLDKSKEKFKAYGRYVQKMAGRYITAADMGIHEEDLDYMREETDYIAGGSAIGSPSPFTAFGVWKGMKACAEEVYGSPSLAGLKVAVQGIGSVGHALCLHLAAEGAEIIAADLDEERLKAAENLWGAKIVDPGRILEQDCDILAPCAGGCVVNSGSIDRFHCRIIAGAANNILIDNHFGSLLREKGILYAPDYIINAGGLIFVEMKRRGIDNHDRIRDEVARIEGRLKGLFKRSLEEKRLPQELADLIAEENLEKGTRPSAL